MDDETYEAVAVEPSHADLLRRVAADHGVRVEAPALRAPDPATVLYVVGAAHLVKAAIEDFLDRRAGGQIIDLREGEVLAKRSSGVEWGRIVIVAADGTLEVREERRDRFGNAVAALLDALRGLAGGTVGQASRAAIDAGADPRPADGPEPDPQPACDVPPGP